MSPISPYIFFDGHAAEAMRFYQSVLGGELSPVLSYGAMPGCDDMGPMSAEVKARTAHVALTYQDGMLMASDTTPDHPYEAMKGFCVALAFPTAARAKEVFEALSAGGTIQMALGKTFWAEAFGSFTDRFGTPWMVNGGMAAA
ncbi:MAG: VOC family protein [Comamonadaceae bacterium]|nr:MAG: VOC family protein [Comamonadaceae bacterium]